MNTPTPSIPFSQRKGKAPRPPRITINPNPVYNSSMPQSSLPPQFTAGPTTYGGGVSSQPYWPNAANPFNQMYAGGRASVSFINKGFEGFVDFTKSGMSFGEKFSYGLYDKISKWSKKWFTHMFLFIVVLLYSVGGALIFKTIEEKHAKREFGEIQAQQKQFFKAIQEVARDSELIELLRHHPEEWNGRVVQTVRDHKDALSSLLNTNKTIEELETFDNPWTFWNSMFYCGTIYTTIDYEPQTF